MIDIASDVLALDAENGKPNRNDFLVNDQGTLFLLTPQSGAARAWVREHIPTDATRWGSAIVVEHRYIRDIVYGFTNDGLTVEREK